MTLLPPTVTIGFCGITMVSKVVFPKVSSNWASRHLSTLYCSVASGELICAVESHYEYKPQIFLFLSSWGENCHSLALVAQRKWKQCFIPPAAEIAGKGDGLRGWWRSMWGLARGKMLLVSEYQPDWKQGWHCRVPMLSSLGTVPCQAAALVPAGMVSFQVWLCSDWKWLSKSSE